MPTINPQQEARRLASYGVHIMAADGSSGFKGYIDQQFAHDITLAADAQPSLVTTSNAGIPAYLANYLEPKVIEVLFSPMKAAEIYGEVKKGDWTTMSAQFPVAESSGEVSSYGDYSNNGQATANINWPYRQSYHFQTITRWGEKELAMAGEARINWAQQLNIASVLTINKAANKIAFFGVSGMENYGALNDPNLPASISPDASGTASGTLWSTKDGAAVYGDLQKLYTQLVSQSQGRVERDTQMTLVLSPSVEPNLTKTNTYNVNVYDQLKKNFPNLRIISAVELSGAGSGSTELVQLFADEMEGQRTVESAFTEKMRAHPVFVDLSSFKQKKSSGSWGSIWYRPVLCASMAGV